MVVGQQVECKNTRGLKWGQKRAVVEKLYGLDLNVLRPRIALMFSIPFHL
jgi:hypothetical protein